jgi:signal transduction histidine kinase
MGAPIVLFAFDHEGRFTLSEGRGLEAMGLQPGEVVGSLVAQVYRDAPDVLAELKHALAGETRSSSIRIGAQTFAVYYRPLDPHSTEYRGSIGVLVDVTEQARAEEALRRLNEELEQRVRLRTAELARAGEELVQSEKLAALGRLVAGIAHELNTPIGNSLLVATALSESALELQQALAGGLRRSQLDAFLASTTESGLLLERSLQRAADLIASFKQVAVDQTSAQRRTFDLAEIVRENVMTLGPSLKRLPVTLVDDVPDGIRMDSYPGPLGQVLANLVTNAVLHAFEGRAHGVVRIEARPAGDGAVALTVTDDGCGIPPENLRRVFDPFFTTRMGKGGSGLGLNIVHTLVTGVLGGRIEVRSEPGSGTRFDITLPCFAPAAAMEPAA